MRRLLGGFSALVVIAAVGCAPAYPPYLLTAIPDAELERLPAVDATVTVLQRAGYTVAMANHELGVVTTDWADRSDRGALFFVGTSVQRRVSANVLRNGQEISVQITTQTKPSWQGWRNAKAGEKEREEGKDLVRQIHALLPSSVTFSLADNVDTWLSAGPGTIP